MIPDEEIRDLYLHHAGTVASQRAAGAVDAPFVRLELSSVKTGDPASGTLGTSAGSLQHEVLLGSLASARPYADHRIDMQGDISVSLRERRRRARPPARGQIAGRMRESQRAKGVREFQCPLCAAFHGLAAARAWTAMFPGRARAAEEQVGRAYGAGVAVCGAEWCSLPTR